LKNLYNYKKCSVNVIKRNESNKSEEEENEMPELRVNFESVENRAGKISATAANFTAAGLESPDSQSTITANQGGQDAFRSAQSIATDFGSAVESAGAAALSTSQAIRQEEERIRQMIIQNMTMPRKEEPILGNDIWTGSGRV